MDENTTPSATDRLPEGSEQADVVGTDAWAAAGGRSLTFRQKLGQFNAAGAAYLSELPSELRWTLSRLGLFPAKKVPKLGRKPLPETAAVEASIRQLDMFAEGEKEMVDHSYRTFYVADLLYRQSQQSEPIDREILAVSMLLHDVGMFPKAVSLLPGADFTLRGAYLARQIAQDAGWSKGRVDQVAQVITLNANGAVASKWGPEAYFGRLAPIVDVVGQVWRINPDDAREIFDGHPLGTLGAEIVDLVGAEAKRHPGSRFALFRPLFPFLVRHCEKRWEKRLAS